jgi:DNA-binding NtrC family response regulator
VTRLILFPDLGREALGIFAAPKTEVAAAPKAPAKSAEEEPDAGLGRLLHLPLSEATDAVVDEFKRSYLIVKLRQHGGNVSQTADAIGVSRQYLHRLIERYGLRVGER